MPNAQFDLRPYTTKLADWLSKTLSEFTSEHPEVEISAIGTYLVIAANTPTFPLYLDTRENSDRTVKMAAATDWPECEDEHGSFCCSPPEFKFEYRNFDFDDFPDIWRSEFEADPNNPNTHSFLTITTADNETQQINLSDIDSEKHLTELLFSFIISVMKSFDGYTILQQDEIFRIVSKAHNSSLEESWIVKQTNI